MSNRIFQVQIQPDLSKDLDLDFACATLREWFPQGEFEHGNDNGPYCNVRVKAVSIGETWNQINDAINLVPGLRDAAIAVCQGKHGWDDYLLLHHYDRSEKTESIE